MTFNLQSLHEIIPVSQLQPSEIFWRDHQEWLASCGYMLRPRYRPGWVASWEGTKKEIMYSEDATGADYTHLLDATRISDGAFVMIKKITISDHPYEAEIAQFLSSEPLASDPKNHCVPIYDVLQDPTDKDICYLIMPLLREHDDPRFDTVGEAVEFFQQIFEGLQFIHKHRVAHRDCMPFNIMMDAIPLYPTPYHPMCMQMKRDFSGRVKTHLTRTQCPVKYYFTDYGLSRRYKPEDGPPLEYPILGGDKTVPEFQKSSEPCNPFPTDVYYLGNVIRSSFTQGSAIYSARAGFEFMEPLVADMVQDDPTKRPTMDEVVDRFQVIRNGLSTWKLRSRVVKVKDSRLVGFFRGLAHWKRRITFMIQGVSPIPTPN